MFGQGDVVGLLGVYAYVVLVVVLASRLGFLRRAGAQRKFVHIMVGNIVLIWWVFDSAYVMAFLAALPFIPLLLLASSRSPIKKVRESFIGKTTGRATTSAWCTMRYRGRCSLSSCSITQEKPP